jgi:hypothetical protein
VDRDKEVSPFTAVGAVDGRVGHSHDGYGGGGRVNAESEDDR